MSATEALAIGREHQRAGRFAEAEQVFRQILQAEPSNAQALHGLGELAAKAGHYQDAVELVRQAIAADGTQAMFHVSLGEALHRWGKIDEAVAAHRQALAIAPNLPLAHAHLGVIFNKRGELDAAEECFRHCVRLRPDLAQSHANLGRVLHDKGLLADAEAAYREATRLAPNSAREHFNLGAILHKLGRHEEACASYRRAIELNPNDAMAHCNLGVVLAERRFNREAEAQYRQAIKLDPNNAPPYNNLAVVLGEQGRYAEAAAVCRDAIALAPDFAPVYCNLTHSLRELGEVDEAIDVALRGIALRADPAAYCNLGMCYQDRGQIDEAIEAYRTGLGLDPADSQQHSNLIYVLNYHPGYEPRVVFEEHREWGRRHADPLLPANPRHAHDRTPDRRLRIGYVSAHFRAHAVAAFTESMLANHDHGRHEIFCYSNTPAPDETTRRFQAAADQWREILQQSDSEACETIRGDKIDILVDLAGHINGNRLLVFARKPAPIQVTYLGYQNTTGMAAMDYRLTDDHADPPGTDPYYTEKLVRLPRSFFCYLPDRAAPQPGPLPALAGGVVTFGSFNQFSKITPDMLATWARLLAAVPQSRLVLLSRPSPWLRARVEELFGRHGVDPARIESAPRRPHREYLRLISGVDVALDSFPFNGHTTTCDCLWQGVPVVTMTGPMYASRFGSTAHINLQLGDLVAETPDEYVEIASRLAGDLDRLRELRASLRSTMLDSPLLDAQGFTRNLEAAYREMWTRWCSS